MSERLLPNPRLQQPAVARNVGRHSTGVLRSNAAAAEPPSCWTAYGRSRTVRNLSAWSHLAAFLLALGCQSYARNTPRTFLEGDNAANYKRVFGEKPSADIQILNSVVVAYGWRPGVVTTDDWEFEILAPRPWVDQHIKSLNLIPARDPPPENEILADIEAGRPVTFMTQHWRDIYGRKLHPIRSWYAPKPLATYDIYYLGATSIPYVHMLVEQSVTLDERHRVFVSKH